MTVKHDGAGGRLRPAQHRIVHHHQFKAVNVHLQIIADPLKERCIINALRRIAGNVMVSEDKIFPAVNAPDQCICRFRRNPMRDIAKNIKLIIRPGAVIDVVNNGIIHLFNIRKRPVLKMENGFVSQMKIRCEVKIAWSINSCNHNTSFLRVNCNKELCHFSSLIVIIY